jgi:AcrR family transcriptional regulator
MGRHATVPRTSRTTAGTTARLERPRRRTQTERSDAMRRRLIDATLQCLTQDGYAATTVSSIVRRAGVSRGAHLHHFPTKNALILEATEFLMRRAYRVLGEMLLAIAEDADRVGAVVDGAWKAIYGTRNFSAYFELITAAKHDPDLASAMQTLSDRTLRTIDGAIGHYFEKRADGVVEPRDLFVLTHWLMSGIAAGERASVSAADSRHFLEVWARLLATQMRSKRGVRTPPPRPADWGT